MSSFGGRIQNPYEVKRLNANSKDWSKVIDYRAIWEAYPRAKSYAWLEPSVRRVAEWSKEGLLTKGGSLLSLFEKQAKIVYKSADNIRHKLYIKDNDLRASIMRVAYEPGQKLGKGRQEFTIWSDAEVFGERSLLLLDSAPEAPLEVRSFAPDGHLWAYQVTLTSDGYINADDIAVGDQITQIGGARGEAADQRAPVHLGKANSYLEFSTPKTSFGWELTVTDKAWKAMAAKNEFYALIRKDDAPEHMESVMTASMLDFKFMAATDLQIDYWLTYGQASGRFEGASLDRLTNKPYDLGPGFYEWMKYSRKEYFTKFSIPWLGDVLNKRWHNNLDPKDREAHFITGTLGLRWWREACEEYDLKASLEKFEINNEIKGKGFDGQRTGVIINKKQVVGVFLPEFGSIYVHYSPHFDDDKFEKRKYKGYSIKSGMFLALDLGFGRGEDANIYIIKDNGENGFGYGNGLWSHYGPVLRNTSLASRWPTTLGAKNAYQLIRDEAFTMVVKDPYSILCLEPAVM